jgi:hypothetical protein
MYAFDLLELDGERVDFYEPSCDGKIRRTVVPWLSLSRSTRPPSCRGA